MNPSPRDIAVKSYCDIVFPSHPDTSVVSQGDVFMSSHRDVVSQGDVFMSSHRHVPFLM